MSASGLLLRGVSGKRSGRVEPFVFGSMRPTVAEPFFVNRDPLARAVVEMLWVHGKVASDVAEPFTLDGPLPAGVEEPFNMAGGETVIYDEGGIAQPALGYWTDRDVNTTTGTR